jgi:hypothetical protein
MTIPTNGKIDINLLLLSFINLFKVIKNKIVPNKNSNPLEKRK